MTTIGAGASMPLAMCLRTSRAIATPSNSGICQSTSSSPNGRPAAAAASSAARPSAALAASVTSKAQDSRMRSSTSREVS